MEFVRFVRGIGLLASFVLAASMPVTAGPAAPAPTMSPVSGLKYLVGAWKCTYAAGPTRFDYAATYTYDRDTSLLRQNTSWAGGGAEELIAYDTHRRGWTVVVVDDQGTTTIMRGPGSDPNHFGYASFYPDASISDRFDRISNAQYALHATVRAGGKVTTSVDTCVRTK